MLRQVTVEASAFFAVCGMMRVQLVTKEDITEALVTIPQNSLFSSITGRGKGVLAESGIISATGVSRLSITGTLRKMLLSKVV